MSPISKTDFLVFCECSKNAWIKIHKRDVYESFPLSEFEKSIIQTGNEVEEYARTLFPGGVLVEGRDAAAVARTQALIDAKTAVIFQPVFIVDGFLAAADILRYNATADAWDLYEVKASNSTKESGDRSHVADLAFQSAVLTDAGIRLGKRYIMHLNGEYVRGEALDVDALFVSDDMSEAIEELMDETREKMARAKTYLSFETEPTGVCMCIYKGRGKHCTTFSYSNPEIPDYSIHDIARIGSSKAKLKELADREIWTIDDLPEQMEFSKNQQAQIDAYRHGTHRDMLGIREELDPLVFPLYFLDYETYPSAIPRFAGFSPYQQIPFQFSLHIVDAPESEPRHVEFLHVTSDDPTPGFAAALKEYIGPVGSIIVWNKKFEMGRNDEVAERLPEYAPTMAAINSRVYDLMDVFTKQHYVDAKFVGSTSIKYVLPVLAPELSYKSLTIQEGGTASEKWNQMTSGNLPKEECEEIAQNLRDYCKLDTYAMYAIWKKLYEIAYK